ncbi:MAG: AAA family ATPase [Halobacteriota archaeon]
MQKYRPTSFDEMLDQDVVKTQLRRIVASKNVPNLLFSGPAGSGKSSAAEVVARELFGDGWEGNFTEINASNVFTEGRKYLEGSRSLGRFYNERKSIIDNFKLIINRIAGVAPLDEAYRIIFINEAEALTQDAQQALRRLIERYNRTCKFILATERPSLIIPPIKSRCLLLHFKQLPSSTLLSYLERLAEQEGYTLPADLALSVIQLCDYNLQKALTALQLVLEHDDSSGTARLQNVSEFVRPEEVRVLLECAIDKQPKQSKELLDRLLLDIGLNGAEILAQALADLRRIPLDERKRASLLVLLGKADYLLKDAMNERIQLEAFIYEIAASLS